MRSDDEARKTFGHLFEAIFDAVTEGVRDYYRDHPTINHKHSIGSRRFVIRDYIIHRLRSAVSDVGDVYIFQKNQTTNFGIHSRFLARVHKLGKELIAAVGHTQASFAFQENAPKDIGLGEDFAAATCLRIGYVPSPSDPMDPRVFIACPAGKRKNAWHIELQRSQGATIVPAPVSPPPDDFDDLVQIVPTPRQKSDEE